MAQFGIFDHLEGIPGTSARKLLSDRLDLIRFADEAGFFAYHLAEHHGTDLCMAPNQEIFLAAAAERTTNIRFGPMVKIIPLHHPLRVIEDICLLDQLSGGRVEYGVGRGIAAIEHFWFQGDWFAAHDRFDEALAIILEGLRTGQVAARDRTHYDIPAIEFAMRPFQAPNPPMWYPGNPVTAGRYGLNLMWPGPIPKDAHDAYVSTWERFRGDPVRADLPNASPRVGTVLMMGVSDEQAEGQAIAARGWRGLARRINAVHTLDRRALDEEQAEAALNPLAHLCRALADPGAEDAMMPELTAGAGTPEHVADVVQGILADGRSDYIVLQLPTGDMTFAESRRSLELFADRVMPLVPQPVPSAI